MLQKGKIQFPVVDRGSKMSVLTITEEVADLLQVVIILFWDKRGFTASEAKRQGTLVVIGGDKLCTLFFLALDLNIIILQAIIIVAVKKLL